MAQSESTHYVRLSTATTPIRPEKPITFKCCRREVCVGEGEGKGGHYHYISEIPREAVTPSDVGA